MSEKLYLNGINGATGQYLTPPVDPADAAARARGEPPPHDNVKDLVQRKVAKSKTGSLEALPLGIEPQNLAKAGWSIVFADGVSAAVRDALQPLLQHRAKKVPKDRLLTFDYHPGEGMRPWLNRHGVDIGSVSPTKIPYYVLLIGSPEEVPFEFQYLLDVDYAVGRLSFDSPEQYAHYVKSVIDYETAAAPPTAREIVYWGTRHPNDFPTRLTADSLIAPLCNGVASDPDDGPAIAGEFKFTSRLFKGAEATKAQLMELLHAKEGAARPTLLFTASHGVGWPRDDERQAGSQGALLCQDWSGLGSILPAHYLAAADVADDARVHGLIAFFFACYGAGTPRKNDFLFGPDQPPPDSEDRLLADRSFLARLPQRLLSHPQGGALAVIGHIERAWAHSIQPLDDQFKPLPTVGPQLTMFRNCVGRILSGDPVGHATKDISEKFANISVLLLSMIGPAVGGTAATDETLVNTWIERNDVQNYVLLGDPAVRLHSKLTT